MVMRNSSSMDRKQVTPAGLGVLVDEFRDLREHFEVFGDLFRDAGALYLDDYQPPVAQGGGVDLPERSCGHGFGVEAGNAFEIRTPSSVVTICSTSA